MLAGERRYRAVLPGFPREPSPATEKSQSRFEWPLHVYGGVLIGALCLWFARAGLFVYFTGDDLMNIHKAWRTPLRQIILENVFYFSPGYRPLGSLIYRLLFETIGMNPFPYRILCFALILGNLYLLYRTAAAIGGREVALLAALFASYNTAFEDLYYNTGTIYDLLCFTFYFAALDLYIRVRRQGLYLKPRVLAIFLILYTCALNSKEMAVSLPLIIALYEVLLRKAEQRTYWRWIPAVVSAAITIPYVFGKFSVSSPLMGNDAYRLHLGWRTYFRAFGHYMALFTHLPPDVLNVTASVLLLILLATIAVLGRQRGLIFSCLFIVITSLPVAFIGLRGGYAMYIASFGIALFLAIVVVKSRKTLARSAFGTLSVQTRRVLQFDTFVLCLLMMLVFHGSRPLPTPAAEDSLFRSTAAQISRVQPKIDPKWRVLFLDDPFPPDSDIELYILRELYRAPDLVVDRVKKMPSKPDQHEIDSYDCILTFEGDRLVRVKPQT